MSLTGRRGFTLVEVIIAASLSLLVGTLGLRLLLGQHWTGVAQGEMALSQSSLRAGLHFLSSELRELGGSAGDPDLLVFSPDSLTYRAGRNTGVSCARQPGSVAIEAASLAGYRGIQAGRDSLWLHFEGGPDTESDDLWISLPVLAVGAGSCPTGPAVIVTTTLDTVSYPARGFSELAPVRSFEVMQVRRYQSGSDYWLGARSVSAGETIQPVLGPLAGSGPVFTGRDSAGGLTTTAGSIRRIDIALTVLSGIPVRRAGVGPAIRLADSIHFNVALRNR